MKNIINNLLNETEIEKRFSAIDALAEITKLIQEFLKGDQKQSYETELQNELDFYNSEEKQLNPLTLKNKKALLAQFRQREKIFFDEDQHHLLPNLEKYCQFEVPLDNDNVVNYDFMKDEVETEKLQEERIDLLEKAQMA